MKNDKNDENSKDNDEFEEGFIEKFSRHRSTTDEKPKKSDRFEIMRATGLFMQLGLSMVFCVVIGFFIGRFLDGFLGTLPVLMIIFSFIGLGAALKVMYDIVKDWE